MIIDFDFEIIVEGSIEMARIERQGWDETGTFERDITTPSAAISTPCWLCQPFPIHDGSHSTCKLVTSICLFLTFTVILLSDTDAHLNYSSDKHHLTLCRNHGFLRGSWTLYLIGLSYGRITASGHFLEQGISKGHYLFLFVKE
jgi:hypothetical protein